MAVLRNLVRLPFSQPAGTHPTELGLIPASTCVTATQVVAEVTPCQADLAVRCPFSVHMYLPTHSRVGQSARRGLQQPAL